jgi:hypothetical protein
MQVHKIIQTTGSVHFHETTIQELQHNLQPTSYELNEMQATNSKIPATTSRLEKMSNGLDMRYRIAPAPADDSAE